MDFSRKGEGRTVNKNNRCDIKCPYFLTDGDIYLTCEGMYSQIVKQKFDGNMQMIRHQRKFCNKYPNSCAIAVQNDKKYTED